MTLSFRVVGGTEAESTKRTLAEARKRARPLIRYWLKKVERAVIDGRLEPVDLQVATNLTNYPSANEGRAYPGLTKQAERIGKCERTVRRSLARLTREGLLVTKRGGPGKTANRFFCFNNVPVFGGEKTSGQAVSPLVAERPVSVQERTHLSDLERTDVSTNPLEANPLEREPPPTPTAECAAPSHGRPSNETEAPSAIDGEIITAEITFSAFWMAAGRKGSEGFARAEWRKLSSDDRFAIAQRLERDGALELRGMWAGAWLRDRLWQESPSEANDPWGKALAGDYARPAAGVVTLAPGSAEWTAERTRMCKAGESTTLMDAQAQQGKGWTVRTAL